MTCTNQFIIEDKEGRRQVGTCGKNGLVFVNHTDTDGIVYQSARDVEWNGWTYVVNKGKESNKWVCDECNDIKGERVWPPGVLEAIKLAQEFRKHCWNYAIPKGTVISGVIWDADHYCFQLKESYKKRIEELDSLEVSACKRILFQMWHRVEIKQFDSRSFVGDTALDLRDTLFKDEDVFWSEYKAWKVKGGK